MGDISPHGSHSLPKDLRFRSKVTRRADIAQMPQRSLEKTAEQSQGHVESDHWFNEANQHVTSQLNGLGDDAPYFPGEIEPGLSGEKHSSPNHVDDPVLSYMRANDSERENEELRGIIDDLTLDIKRLKQKLRRYKERDPPRLQGDKLFDVRTYGLPRQKKRQLEQILQHFASEMSGSSRLPRNKSARTKSKHSRDNALIQDDDARKVLVAILFKQHLGLLAAKASMQHLASTPPESESWYDLNEMLDSIKQMVSNIDVEFSREALKKHGVALELSADGHRVRWRNSDSQGSTRPSIGSSVIYDHVHNHYTDDRSQKTFTPQETILGLAASNTTLSQNAIATHYVPYKSTTQKNEADDDVLSMVSSGSEMSFHAAVGDGCGTLSNTRPQTHRTSRQRLTYYKNANFYLDCFGDSPDVTDVQPRKSSLTESVGEKRKRQTSPALSSRQQRRHTHKTPADRFHSYPSEKDLAMNLSQCSSPVLSLTEEPLTSVEDGHKAFPMELAASGVGDVTPNDNFAVHVVMKHVPVNSSDDAGGFTNHHFKNSTISRNSHHPFKNAIPAHDQRNGMINGRKKNLFNTYLVTATREELAPSSLPPATCGFFSSASSDDSSDDDRHGENADEESDDTDDNQSHMNLPNVPRDGLHRVGVVDSGSSVSVHPIEKWNAQVVASLGNHGENEAVPLQASGSM